ncbi:3'-5' exonuclease [Thermophagus sp. OGC60D27]|uniref:3'-5' exonuclease n=1 Tax=Thermophagus sp. OGC60D27 TaxID=3458415 RepID=UPI0040377631
MLFLLAFSIILLIMIINKLTKPKSRSTNKVKPSTTLITDSKTGEPEYFIFDVETSGLPRFRQAKASNTRAWPRAVQVSWILLDAELAIIKQESHIIKPHKFKIPEEAAKVHGITHEKAMAEGKSVNEVFPIFIEDLDKCSTVVCHNAVFDVSVMESEFKRHAYGQSIVYIKKIHCTMIEGTKYCKIPSDFGRGYKYPKLEELYQFVTGDWKLKKLPKMHDAANDALVTAICFKAMKGENVKFKNIKLTY